MNSRGSRKNSLSQLAVNRRARFDYFIEEQFEAGLVLEGWEVKSARAKKIQLRGSYVIEQGGELFLTGSYITPLPSASSHIRPQADRTRKLLLNRREIDQVVAGIKRKGYSCTCLSLYLANGRIKASIALVRGKKQHDKRDQSKRADWARERQRLLKKDITGNH